MNFTREGFPSKFQLELYFQRLFLNFGDPFARILITVSLGAEKKSLTKYPVAKKETILAEGVSFSLTLFECPVNKYNDCWVEIEANLLKKENQRRFVGEFRLNISEYASKARMRSFEDNFSLELNDSSHYNGKLDLGIKLAYHTKKQARSLSHTSFETKEIVLPFRTESPKKSRFVGQPANNRFSEHSNAKERANYDSKKEPQKSSPDPRISIMELENNPEYEVFGLVEKLEKCVQTEARAMSFCEQIGDNKPEPRNSLKENALGLELQKTVENLNEKLRESDLRFESLNREIASKEALFLEEKRQLEESFLLEKRELESMIQGLQEEKKKEKLEALRKLTSMTEEREKQIKKESTLQKTIRSLENSVDEQKNQLQTMLDLDKRTRIINEKEIESLSLEVKNLILHNESLKKQLEAKEKKLSVEEESNARLQTETVAVKQRLAEVINLIFQMGGTELMETVEGLLGLETKE